jgi:uncharacterized Zn finger protein
MKLITNCDSCKEDLKVSALMVENRIDLAKRKGKEFELRCKSCGHYNFNTAKAFALAIRND